MVIADGSAYCWICGTSQNVMFVCKVCGETVSAGSAWCQKCGARTDGNVVCEVCGEAVLSGATWCRKCNARVDGKISCKVCGDIVTKGTGYCQSCGNTLKGPPLQQSTVICQPHNGCTAAPATEDSRSGLKYNIHKKGGGGLLVMGIVSVVLCSISLILLALPAFFYSLISDVSGIALGIMAFGMGIIAFATAIPRMKQRAPLVIGAFFTGLAGMIFSHVPLWIAIMELIKAFS